MKLSQTTNRQKDSNYLDTKGEVDLYGSRGDLLCFMSLDAAKDMVKSGKAFIFCDSIIALYEVV